MLLLYLVLLLLHLFSALTRSSDLWGIDQWRYIPSLGVAIFLPLGLLAIVPSFRKRVIEFAEWAGSSRRAKGVERLPFIGPVLILAIAALLFWSFRQATHFLGDGNLWIKAIETSREARSWDLAVSFSLYRAVSNLFGLFGNFDAETSAGVISVASGLLFLVYAWKTSRQLAKRRAEQTFLVLALLSTGSMMLFFGYIEAYPPAAAVMMVYLYYAVRFIEGKGGIGAAAMAFAAAVILHPSMIALLPSLVLLVIWRSGARPGTRRFLSALSIGVAAGLITLRAFQHWRIFGGYFGESFLPFMAVGATNRVPYPIISWGNFLDTLNELALVCPIAIFSLSFLSTRDGEMEEMPRRRILFFATASICFVLLFAIGNEILGASRDWDVFAPMAVPLALMTALLLLHRYGRWTRDLAVLALCILLIHTVPWITINASAELSLRRFSDLSRNPRWSGFARGYAYDELATHYFYGEDLSRALRYSLASIEADPGNVRYLYNAGLRYMVANRHEEAIRMFEQVIRKREDYLDARLNLGTIYVNLERYRDAREQFEQALRLAPASVFAHSKLAHICWREGREQEASELYSKAIELEPGNPEHHMNLALLELNAGRRLEARRLMERAIEVEPGYALAYLHLGRLCTREGELDRACELYDRHLELEPEALDARFELAVMLDRAGRLDEAMKHLLHIDEARPGDIRVMNNIGVIYSRKSEFEQAVRVFEKALRADSNHSELLINAARAYCRVGDYRRAWACVIRAERLGATPPEGLLSELNSAMLRPGAE